MNTDRLTTVLGTVFTVSTAIATQPEVFGERASQTAAAVAAVSGPLFALFTKGTRLKVAPPPEHVDPTPIDPRDRR